MVWMIVALLTSDSSHLYAMHSFLPCFYKLPSFQTENNPVSNSFRADFRSRINLCSKVHSIMLDSVTCHLNARKPCQP